MTEAELQTEELRKETEKDKRIMVYWTEIL
jgi:hypothetical protein